MGAMGGVPLAVAALGGATPAAQAATAAQNESVTAAQKAAFDNPPYPEKGDDVKPAPRRGRIKQAVTRGVFTARPAGAPPAARGAGPQPGGMPFDDMCRHAARLGIKGFDLVAAADWPTLKKYGLVSTMIYGIGVGGGRGATPASGAAGAPAPAPAPAPKVTDKAFYDHFLKIYSDTIELAAENGFPNIILTTGSRGTKSDEDNADGLVALLNGLKARAEDKGINLCTELISSNQTQPLENRYQGDHAAWVFGVVKRVNSPRVKVLFDIFHAQVMDGNVVRHIRDNFQWIAHFHTGGNPPVGVNAGARNELDHTQELYWPFVMKAIADLGFTGYVAHEYTPAAGMDPIASLEKCIRICDA